MLKVTSDESQKIVSDVDIVILGVGFTRTTVVSLIPVHLSFPKPLTE